MAGKAGRNGPSERVLRRRYDELVEPDFGFAEDVLAPFPELDPELDPESDVVPEEPEPDELESELLVSDDFVSDDFDSLDEPLSDFSRFAAFELLRLSFL